MNENRMEAMNIQWFPGHMTKARRMMEENLSLVDAVCEFPAPAEIPRSTAWPQESRAW